MAFSFVDSSTVFDAFKESQKYMRPFFEPLEEYQRIARNRPHPSIDKAYPKTTDGSTASIIQKTPRRIIQQLPTGKVTSDTNDWTTVLAEFIYTQRILENANSQYALIQKSWLAVKGCLTNGATAGFVPFVHRGKYFGTDLTIPNIKDLFLEKGKVSDTDSNVIFMRGWYQPNDIKAIIARETKLSSNAKDRKETYESGWDLQALAKIENSITQKDDLSTTSAEKARGSSVGGVEIIHVFQRGIGAKFYSVHVPTKAIVRTTTNKDPRGEIPIHYLYADIDGFNPLGSGYVELVGSLQNLIDAEMQMYQYNRALMLNPPVLTYGINSTGFKFAPNTVNKALMPEAYIKPVTIDTSAIVNFPSLYGLTKSQLLNLLASPDASISAEIGNPGFSKTDAGVKQQQGNISVDDNYIRKMYETWFGRVSETMINRYFAERSGKEEIQLDERTAEKMRELNSDAVSPDNKIMVDWDTETEELSFQVDASTSNMQDNQKQMEILDGLLDRYEKAPILQQLVPQQKITGVWNSIVDASGVEDPEKLKIEEQKDEQGNPMQGNDQASAQHAQEMQAAQQQIQELQQKLAEEQQVPYKDAPEDIKRQKEERAGYTPSQMKSPVQIASDQKSVQLGIQHEQAQIQAIGDAHNHAGQVMQPEATAEQAPEEAPEPGITPDDDEFISALQQNGVPDQHIGVALAMLHHGKTPDEIMNTLQEAQYA